MRIEQSKGLKDRIVCLSGAAVEALHAYLDVRGPAPTDHVFTFCHQPLSNSYCYERLRTYSRRCGLHVTPHQLRHSCATLLLNAGAPVLTVQTILGHKHEEFLNRNSPTPRWATPVCTTAAWLPITIWR